MSFAYKLNNFSLFIKLKQNVFNGIGAFFFIKLTYNVYNNLYSKFEVTYFYILLIVFILFGQMLISVKNIFNNNKKISFYISFKINKKQH